MKILNFIIIIFLYTGISQAADFNKEDIEWDSAASATLYIGDSLVNGEYTIVAKEFSMPVPGIKNLQGNIVPDAVVEPLVYLEIYKSGAFIEEIVMGMESEPYAGPDYEYRISVSEFPRRNSREWVYEYYSPWVKLSVQKRAYPDLQIELTTNKTAYITGYDRIIYAKVMIINKGKAFAEDVNVNFNIGDLKLNSGDERQLHQTFMKIGANSVESIRVTLIVPDLIDEKSYYLNADAQGFDVKGKKYSASGSSSIIVTPRPDYFHISKSVRDRIYLGENDTVKITVANGGLYDIRDITVEDSLSENFQLEKNSTLQWNIPLLKPGEEWHTSYTMRPLKTNLNGFDIPEASAKFLVNNKPQKMYSEKTKVIVNGPIIVINKTPDKDVAYINEDVMVRVSIRNSGNTPTKIQVKDVLPDGAVLVSGKTSLGPVFMQLNKPQEFTYVFRKSTEGEVRLSPAVATYTDLNSRGVFYSEISSNSPEISFIETGKEKPVSSNIQASNGSTGKNQSVSGTKISLSEQAAAKSTPITPGFGAISPIIIIVMIMFLNKKRS